jgi:hypothetical protein
MKPTFCIFCYVPEQYKYLSLQCAPSYLCIQLTYIIMRYKSVNLILSSEITKKKNYWLGERFFSVFISVHQGRTK